MRNSCMCSNVGWHIYESSVVKYIHSFDAAAMRCSRVLVKRSLTLNQLGLEVNSLHHLVGCQDDYMPASNSGYSRHTL
jgi:hypothetical protein